MNRKQPSILIVILGILVSLACVVTVPVPGYEPSPVPPTPDLALTRQIQTQNAVPTITATATDTPLPTLTVTSTLTLFPTITPIPTGTPVPSVTPTAPTEGIPVATLESMGILPATMTAMVQDPKASGDPIGSLYSCIVSDQKLHGATTYSPNSSFTVWWDVINAGTKKWQNGLVLISLVEGKRMSVERHYSMPSDVAPGEKVRLKVEMQTPKQEGVYKMTWGLESTPLERHFCFFTLLIVVKK
jgi:hypothetical protein